MIRARQAHDDVAADPDTFRPVAEAIVAEARRARQPEALALALRALAWAERSRRDDRSAIRLLDQASRIARRHHLADTLADVLMTHAAVSQELGRMAAAHRDLRAAAALVSGTRTAELDFQRALLMQNTGRLAEAAEIYRRMLSDPGVSARRTVHGGNNLALIESQQGRYGQALRRLGQALRKAAEIGPAVVAVVATSRAWVTVQSGRFAEGLGLFEEAAKAHQAAALPLGEHYIEYADALMELRLLPEAISAARQAVQEFSAVGIPLMAAEAQLRVAQLALLAGDASQAIAASHRGCGRVPGAATRSVALACRPRHGGGAADERRRHARRPVRGPNGGPAPRDLGYDVGSGAGPPRNRSAGRLLRPPPPGHRRADPGQLAGPRSARPGEAARPGLLRPGSAAASP